MYKRTFSSKILRFVKGKYVPGMSAAESKQPFKSPPAHYDPAKPAADQVPENGSSRLETVGR